MTKYFSVLFVLLVFCCVTVQAREAVSLPFKQKERVLDKSGDLDPLYHTIGDVKIRLIEETSIDEDKLFSLDSLGDVIIAVDKLIALGKKVWEIVDAGRPSIDARLNPISVLPNVDDPQFAFSRMSGWSAPTLRRYQVSYENLYGINVVDFEFTVVFQANGKYEDKGAYLTGVNIVANTISVAWGFTFKADSRLITIANCGTMDEPVAGATIQLNYLAQSGLKEIRSSVLFYLDGRGGITKL